jgi:hypothetical protein
MINDAGATDEALLRAIGEAVQAYAKVETTQASLLHTFLGISARQARTIYFTVQNVRSRNEMFAGLLFDSYAEKYKRYWESVGLFLSTLSIFRNAVVHWIPVYVVAVPAVGVDQPEDEGKGRSGHGIHNPMPGRQTLTLMADDLRPFLDDCLFIMRELSAFRRALENAHDLALQERFVRPITRRNSAVLQLQTPTVTPPRSSRAKRPSSAQRRKKSS